MDTAEAVSNTDIRAKYKNPHLDEWPSRSHLEEDDVVLFGDPILSRVFSPPVLFNKALALQLSLNIPFVDGRTDVQCISSATREWREITNEDVNIIRATADSCQRPLPVLRSTEEVAEALERDIEECLSRNPNLIVQGARVESRQRPLGEGRIDLLLAGPDEVLTVVEVKLNWIGRDALRQLQNYMRDLQAVYPGKRIKGALVCAGVMPAYKDELQRQKDIRTLRYGWELRLEGC